MSSAKSVGTRAAARPSGTESALSRLRQKGWRHWLLALVILVAAFLARPQVDAYLHLETTRSWVSQRLLELHHRPLEPRYVKLVLIGDEEYWHGELAARVPIKRDYIARLVAALDAANVRTIALDFDMRLPDPARLEDLPDYRGETDQLIQAIRAAAEQHKVVLPKTIRRAGAGLYRLEPDVYQLYGICTRPVQEGRWIHTGTATFPIGDAAARNIACGYIALTIDKRVLPSQLPLVEGHAVDSFALAITRTRNPAAAIELGTQLRYGSFITPATFYERGVIHAAQDVMRADPHTLAALNGEIVIVGGEWSRLAYGRGPKIDLHQTPVGWISGAILHANFAEALLDARAYRHVPAAVLTGLEVLFSLVAAVIFAVSTGLLRLSLFLVALTVALLGIQWITLHTLGVLFEAFVPLVAVWLHALIERLVK